MVVTGCWQSSYPPPVGTCENRDVSELRSVDGLFRAVRFTRRCGYESPTLNVSVLAKDTILPNQKGNAFAERPREGGGRGYETRLDLMWDTSGRLTIVHSPNMAVDVGATEVDGVPIEQTTLFDGGG